MRPRINYLITLLSLLVSCDFQPDETLFTSIQEPSTEGLNITLENYPSNEYFLKERTEFFYTVQTAGKQLIETRVLLNNVIYGHPLLQAAALCLILRP